jgi:hypothetical protein
LIGGRFILCITNRETAVPREIIPLEQDKISCEAIWKLELVTEEIGVAETFNCTELGWRNVGPTRIVWVGGFVV